MLVPNSWLEGYRRDNNTLNAGTIVGVDFDQPHSKYFQPKCGNEIYAMRNDAVHEYVDADHMTYDTMKFCLLLNAPANPANEDGLILQQNKKQKIIWRMRTMVMTMTMMRRMTS